MLLGGGGGVVRAWRVCGCRLEEGRPQRSLKRSVSLPPRKKQKTAQQEAAWVAGVGIGVRGKG